MINLMVHGCFKCLWLIKLFMVSLMVMAALTVYGCFNGLWLI